MSKVVFIADIHLGVSNRLNDIIWSLNATRQYCIHHGIDVVVILGDLFHDRDSLSLDVLCSTYDFFEVDDGINWIAFPGNHDMYLKHSWDINSLKPLRNVLTVIDTVKILTLDGRRFWILPFIYNERPYMNLLHEIEKHHRPGDVLLTHIGVSDAIKNICFLLQDWALVNFEDSVFAHIFTGHYHIRQKVGDNLWYVGSPIPFKFDEGDCDHGFTVFDINTSEQEHINILDIGKEYSIEGKPPPQFHTILDKDIDSQDQLSIRGNHIRIATTKQYNPCEKIDLRNKIAKYGPKRISFLDLTDDDKKVLIKSKENNKIAIDDIFEEWMVSDDVGSKGLRPNLLLKLEKEIRVDGNEIYNKISHG